MKITFPIKRWGRLLAEKREKPEVFIFKNWGVGDDILVSNLLGKKGCNFHLT